MCMCPLFHHFLKCLNMQTCMYAYVCRHTHPHTPCMLLICLYHHNRNVHTDNIYSKLVIKQTVFSLPRFMWNQSTSRFSICLIHPLFLLTETFFLCLNFYAISADGITFKMSHFAIHLMCGLIRGSEKLWDGVSSAMSTQFMWNYGSVKG